MALPHELTGEQRAHIVIDFARENFMRKGLVADANIHPPPREAEEGKQPNHHIHILVALREIGPDGFGGRVVNAGDLIAVEKALVSLPPHRSVRAQFRHTALTLSGGNYSSPDVKALARPRVYYERIWQVSGAIGLHSFPCDAVSLAASSKALKPDESDLVIETAHGPIVPGHTVIGIVPLEHGPQPSTIYVDGPIHPDAEFIFDPMDLGEHDLALVWRPMTKDPSFLRRSQKCVNSRKSNVSGFALAPPAPVSGSKPAELDQASFVGVQTERKASQPFL